MDLRVKEAYQIVRQEVTTHWKTGAVMVPVAIVVSRVYGRVAAGGVILITLSNYQIIGKQIRVLTWTSARKTLIAVVLFGNNYFMIINPQLMGYLAIALMLIDNFQLSTLNDDLSTQNTTLNDNNTKLREAHDALKSLETELLKLQGGAIRVETAEKGQEVVIDILESTIPNEIINLPERLQAVAALLKGVTDSTEMQELTKHKQELKAQIKEMLIALGEISSEFQSVTSEVAGLSRSLESTFTHMEKNVSLTSRQLIVLKEVSKKLQRMLS